jgi:class I fructose-bisphosphate aldolase
MATSARTTTIETRLGAKAQALLEFNSPKIPKERLHLPGPDFIDRVWFNSDRNIRVLSNLQRIYDHGRLGKTGYLSIFPVDQGSEHAAMRTRFRSS